MLFSRSAILVIFFGVVALAIVLWGTSHNRTICDHCNVIVISIDSLRADHVGINGYSRPTTPNIDAFARDAVNFTHYFSAAYLTPMSAMSAQTGMYPWNHGVINFQSYLRDGVHTLAERLADQGYATAAFGNSPEFTIYPTLHNDFSRGFDVYVDSAVRSTKPWQKAQHWIENTKQPFYLWIPIGSAHWPYGQNASKIFSDPSYNGIFAPSRLDQAAFNYMFDSKIFAPRATDFHAFFEYFSILNPHPNYPYDPALAGTVQKVEPSDIQYVVDRYDDGIAEIDRQVGNFLLWLREKGFDRNTIVVIESEHGEEFAEHGYIGHLDSTEATTHVPLFVRIPGLSPRRVSALTSNIDLMPTILQSLGIISRSALDGRSLVPLLTGGPDSFRDAVYMTRTPLWERVIANQDMNSFFGYFRQLDDKHHYHDTAIRTDRWKLVHRIARDAELRFSLFRFIGGEAPERDEYELYDLAADPRELHSVASAHPDIVASLKEKLLSWESMLDARPFPSIQNDHQEYF